MSRNKYHLNLILKYWCPLHVFDFYIFDTIYLVMFRIDFYLFLLITLLLFFFYKQKLNYKSTRSIQLLQFKDKAQIHQRKQVKGFTHQSKKATLTPP
jgi:hypothetical protein